MPQGAQLRAPGPGCIRVRRSPLLRQRKQGAPAAAVIPSSSGYRFQVTSGFLSPVFRKEGSHSREGPREPPPESGTGRHQVLEIGLGAV